MNEIFKEQLNKHDENKRHDLNPYRSQVIDEVADAVLKIEGGFGQDTVQSFATYIRGLK